MSAGSAVPRRPGVLALAAAVIAALTLGGCGADADPESVAGTPSSSASSNSTSASRSPASAASTRTVPTAFGAVAVPVAPERVVTLAESALDVALAVGVTPVGTTASRGGDEPPAYLGKEAAAVPVVATVREPNLEAVLEATPDLILAAGGLEKAQYDALTKIAPTVVPEDAAMGEWAEPLHTYARALDADDQLTRRLDAVLGRARALADRRALAGTAAVVRWMDSGPVIMNAANMPGSLLQAAGAQPVKAAVDLGDSPHSDPLSLENLTTVDADRLFLAAFGSGGASALDAARDEPAFARLKAARSGATSSVDGGVWSSSSGPIAAETVLGDIEAAVR